MTDDTLLPFSFPAIARKKITAAFDVVHGHQQLSPFNAHYDERCFLPIHIYDTATGRPDEPFPSTANAFLKSGLSRGENPAAILLAPKASHHE